MSNTLDACQLPPPSFEYSNAPVPLAVTVIVPSATLQSVGLVEATFVILCADGEVKINVLFTSIVSNESYAILPIT